MAKVNKMDFQCGAFLSYLISNGVKEPTLFEASEQSKIVKFTLRDKDYCAYLKYVSRSTKSVVAEKSYTRWDIPFTDKEKQFLRNSFEEMGKENIVVLVCTNESFKDTYFAIINLESALMCIGEDCINAQSRISIKRMKGSKYVSCYGTALSDENAIQLKYDFDEVFGFNIS